MINFVSEREVTPHSKPQVKFSVVIPTYNRSDYAVQAVQSVVEQTYPAHEIIVVCDGSSDGTANAIKEIYPHVIVFEQKNLGRAVARNSGISLATGDWIGFLDDDDMWHRNKLKVAVQYISEHPNCEAINNPVWFFAEEGGPDSGFGFPRDFAASTLEECHRFVSHVELEEFLPQYLNIQGQSFMRLLELNRGVMSATLVQRSTLIRAGCFCAMQSFAEDWTAFVNIARLCEWHTIPRRLGFTRLHSSQSLSDGYVAVANLAAQVNAWYTGRPMIQRTRGMEMMSTLASYAPFYRSAIQDYLWGALRAQQFQSAGVIWSIARLLLPRLADRIYVLIPPQATWRWERYILRRH